MDNKNEKFEFWKEFSGMDIQTIQIKTWKKHAMSSQSITMTLLLYAFLLAEKFFCFSDEIQLIKK